MSLRCARGQASLMMVAVVGVLLALTVVLFAFGSALGAKGRHQRAADLAAISAAQVMRELYPRLFEPPFLAPDVPNPHHLEQADYLALARAAAVRGAQRNGVRIAAADVSFPGDGFARTRVRVRLRGDTRVARREPAPLRDRARSRTTRGI
jgi:putative Flp pilus-assembly TadE/G-like protein